MPEMPKVHGLASTEAPRLLAACGGDLTCKEVTRYLRPTHRSVLET